MKDGDIARRLAEIQAHIAEGLRLWRYQSTAGVADTMLPAEQIRQAQDERLMRAEHMVRELLGEVTTATLVCTEHVRVSANYDTLPKVKTVEVAIFWPKNLAPEFLPDYNQASSWTVAEPLLERSSDSAQGEKK